MLHDNVAYQSLHLKIFNKGANPTSQTIILELPKYNKHQIYNGCE